MELGHRLNLDQTQELVMTPKLTQAIKILQYNNIELEKYINSEIEKNPLLEIEDDNLDSEEVNWDEYMKHNKSSTYTPSNNEFIENKYDEFISYDMGLEEYLLSQLNLLKLNNSEKRIGTYIIQNIDNDGYLKISVSDIAKSMNIKEAEVIEVLNNIQKFEPMGIAARNIQECLKIQIKNSKKLSISEREIVFIVIDNYLEDLGNNRIEKIAQKLKLSNQKVQKIGDYIGSLEPFPGRKHNNFKEREIEYIRPDASIRLIDGEYIVLVNDSIGTRLRINSYYEKLLREDTNKDCTEYLRKKLDSALWVVKSIEQRRNTIKKVIESIIKHQIDFFDKQDGELVPMKLEDVANDIKMHKSTVSRVTTDKYVDTPLGMFELKYFFTIGLGDSENLISSQNIKNKIIKIIDLENKEKPLSDQKIVDKLKSKNIKISRRTVAKYRSELEIPSSTKRKKFS